MIYLFSNYRTHSIHYKLDSCFYYLIAEPHLGVFVNYIQRLCGVVLIVVGYQPEKIWRRRYEQKLNENDQYATQSRGNESRFHYLCTEERTHTKKKEKSQNRTGFIPKPYCSELRMILQFCGLKGLFGSSL